MTSSSSKQASSSPTWLKSGYGSAEIGLTAMEVMLQVYLLELYVSVGLNPVWAGAALAIAVVWDAVSDPLMGVISDRTPARTAAGKRLPYFGVGVPLAALALVSLYSPSAGASEGALFLRLLGWYLLLNTAMTLVIVPYLALINDLAKGKDDRSGFFGWRLFFSGGGLILGLSIPAILTRYADPGVDVSSAEFLVENRGNAASWIAGFSLLTAVFAAAVIWKPSRNVLPEKHAEGASGFLKSLSTAWRSRAFRYVVAAFVFISLGRAVNASLALIFYKGTLGFDDDQVAFALIGLSLTVMIATPLWVFLGKRWGKRRLSIGGSLVLTLLTGVFYPLMPPEAVGPVVFIVVAGGVAASSVVLLEALFSDVVEEDGLKSDMELTGSYYGLWRMATKFARAGGLAVSGLFLGAIGYVEGSAEQSDAVYRSVAWAFGPGVAVFFGIGTFLLWKEFRKGSGAK